MNPFRDLDERIESAVESRIGHQIGYQYVVVALISFEIMALVTFSSIQNHNTFRSLWGNSSSVITYQHHLLSKGTSHLNLSTGIWTAGATGIFSIFVTC